MIQVLDLQINNLASLVAGLERTGYTDIKISENLMINHDQGVLFIPGNGNFGRASEMLDKNNLRNEIIDFHHNGGKIVGICLGMQLFAESSEESTTGRGLGIIEGEVRKFPKNISRVPHIGWNEIYPLKNDSNLNLQSGMDVYFCHSYYFDVSNRREIYATTLYEDFEFPSIVIGNGILGIQFHPEKSSKAGKEVLNKVKEWINV